MKTEEEKTKKKIDISMNQNIRNLSLETRMKIIEVQEILTKKWQFNVTLNQTISNIINEGCITILTNEK